MVWSQKFRKSEVSLDTGNWVMSKPNSRNWKCWDWEQSAFSLRCQNQHTLLIVIQLSLPKFSFLLIASFFCYSFETMFEFLLARSTQFADLTGEHEFCRHCNGVYYDSRHYCATSTVICDGRVHFSRQTFHKYDSISNKWRAEERATSDHCHLQVMQARSCKVNLWADSSCRNAGNVFFCIVYVSQSEPRSVNVWMMWMNQSLLRLCYAWVSKCYRFDKSKNIVCYSLLS